MASPLSEEIRTLSFYNKRPVIFHGNVSPFIMMCGCCAYVWTFGYFEVSLIAFQSIDPLAILIVVFCLWSVHVRCALTCGEVSDPFKANWVKVAGFTGPVKLHHKKDHDDAPLWFNFQKMKYMYDDQEKTFIPISFPIDQSIHYYMDSKGYQEEEEVIAASKQYGKNSTVIIMDIPKFTELFTERATAPFFVLQVFFVGLWRFDEDRHTCVIMLFMLIASEADLVNQQLRKIAEIKKMEIKPYLIPVYRNNKWINVMTDELLPGDLVSIVRSFGERMIPCDMLLLRGLCIVDESVLTGESVPVMKEPVEELDPSHYLNIELDGKLHVLYGGTKVVQHTPPSKTTTGIKSSNNGCLAYVLRHSFNTSQGKLLRTILYGVKPVTENGLETFSLIRYFS